MSRHRTIAERFAREVKAKYGRRIEQIILFGSVARGEDREDSDVDLLVVTPESTHDLQWDIARETTELLAREGVLIAALVVTAKEWGRSRGTSFGRRVETEGLVLA